MDDDTTLPSPRPPSHPGRRARFLVLFVCLRFILVFMFHWQVDGSAFHIFSESVLVAATANLARELSEIVR